MWAVSVAGEFTPPCHVAGVRAAHWGIPVSRAAPRLLRVWGRRLWPSPPGRRVLAEADSRPAGSGRRGVRPPPVKRSAFRLLGASPSQGWSLTFRAERGLRVDGRAGQSAQPASAQEGAAEKGSLSPPVSSERDRAHRAPEVSADLAGDVAPRGRAGRRRVGTSTAAAGRLWAERRACPAASLRPGREGQRKTGENLSPSGQG